jgi:hypothetical protein
MAYASVKVRLAIGMVNVSPEFVVFDAVNAPYHKRTGVPAPSQTSSPTTVVAGIKVYVRAPGFDVDPAAAVENVTV